ncbi:hypothetical protein [Polycyclovorans algicola]|uniref:hypothetical protein n=1 Tax=Polycyclovorans algicola TaxID=616992 RepID=UPI0004A6EEF6|nr:hypothetical protein [Polycyclovorans algicola]
MKIATLIALGSMALCSPASAQGLPTLNLSLVASGLPLVGTLGFEGLGLGGANLFTAPTVDPQPGFGHRLPSLTLTAQLVDLPGLGTVGVADLVIGGDRLLGPGLPSEPALQGTLQGLGGVVGVLNPGALLQGLPAEAL